MEAQLEGPNDQHMSERTWWFADMTVDLNPAWQSEVEYLFGDVMTAPDPLQSSTDLLTGRPGDPIVWLLRLRLVEALHIDLEKELDLVSEPAEVDPRYYWRYRRSILKKIGTTALCKELNFTTKIIWNNAKNYYAWSHRQWILKVNKNLLKFDEELGYCDKILRKDACNAFAWNQRLFVVRCAEGGTALKHLETVYAIGAIQYQPDNEYPWIYLTHLHNEDMTSLCYEYHDFYVDVLQEEISRVDALKSESDEDMLALMNRSSLLHALNLILEFLTCGYKPKPQRELVKVINFLYPDSSAGLIYQVKSIIRSLDRKADWRGVLKESLGSEHNTVSLERITIIEDVVNGLGLSSNL